MRAILPRFADLALTLVLTLALTLMLGACTARPDAERVGSVVSERLNQAFGPGTFTVDRLRRMGSGPLAADPEGRARAIVYFNAVLDLHRDLDFAAWDTLNAAAFADLLGATERGLSGPAPGGNRPGDRFHVHGSVSFVRGQDAWQPVEVALPPVGTASAPLSPASRAQSEYLFARLMRLYDRQSADPQRQRRIIDEALAEAYASVKLRLDRLERRLILAGGPVGGEYESVAGLLTAALAAPGLPADAAATRGSVENLGLLRTDQADLALVQSNLAADALAGTGDFAAAGPDPRLRALASLFPEPLHLIVPADSDIRAPADLAGRRVAIGEAGSGSRVNALLLLEAAGVAPGSLALAAETGLDQGLRDLDAGRLDAVIATIGAPAERIREEIAAGRVRLVPLPPPVRAALLEPPCGLVAMTLPPATYPGQPEPVETLAVTALLVGTEALPAAEVERVLGTLFDQIDFLAAGSLAGSQISRRNAAAGLTLPLHPAAERFFARPGP